MKKLIAVCILLISGNIIRAQYLTPDTIRRHEISVSVLPVISAFSGSFRASTLTNFNFGYKYYFKNKFVLRTAVVIFPKGFESPYNAGTFNYHSTVGIKNVFSVYNAYGSVKSQFNLGLEKIYKHNRLIHGVGVDMFVNHVNVTYRERYIFRYANQTLVWSSVVDTTNYNIDSLGYTHKERKFGAGVQAFYSVKYKISKRFYLSATMGPSINFSFVNGELYENRTQQTVSGRSFQIDFPNVGFISDVSICFRL